MPVVRVAQRAAPANPAARPPVRGNQLPNRLPVLQPPILHQQTEFYTEEVLDQPDSYNYLPTMLIADQHGPMLTEYYSNHMPVSHYYYPPHHQTLQRVIPTYPSIVYYNR